MPTRIQIARGSLEAFNKAQALEEGELFWEKVQPESNQDGTLDDNGSGEQVEPISTVAN